jgi:hypothetical protein
MLPKLLVAARPDNRRTALRDVLDGVTLASMNVPQVPTSPDLRL